MFGTMSRDLLSAHVSSTPFSFLNLSVSIIHPVPLSLLTVDDHLQAGSTGSPGEVQLTVGQTGAMVDDGCLPCVELRSWTVESHHLTVPHHHQTHPTDLQDTFKTIRENAGVLACCNSLCVLNVKKIKWKLYPQLILDDPPVCLYTNLTVVILFRLLLWEELHPQTQQGKQVHLWQPGIMAWRRRRLLYEVVLVNYLWVLSQQSAQTT